MNHKKIEQIKRYSKIIKYKKKNGQIEELKVEEDRQMEEKPEFVGQEEDDLKDQDFQDPVQDQFEEEDAWESEKSEEEEGPEQESGTMMSEAKTQKMEEEQPKKEVYLGTNKQLSKGEVL